MQDGTALKRSVHSIPGNSAKKSVDQDFLDFLVEDEEEHEIPRPHSSDVLVEYNGETKAVTDIINIYESEGDDIRTQWLKALRETVLETKRALSEARKTYDLTEDLT